MVEPVGRVFAAVPLPPVIRMALADALEPLDIPGRLVPPENWHLTLRFLGSVDRPTFEIFARSLSRVESTSTFRIRMEGLGGFPRPESAAVVWAGITTASAMSLGALNEIAEDAAQAAGLEPEDRPFRPHLTLSRVRPPEGIGHLTDVELDLTWIADSVVLYRSHLDEGPAQYEPLMKFSLAG